MKQSADDVFAGVDSDGTRSETPTPLKRAIEQDDGGDETPNGNAANAEALHGNRLAVEAGAAFASLVAAATETNAFTAHQQPPTSPAPPPAAAALAASASTPLAPWSQRAKHRWARQPAGQPASLKATATVPVTAAEQTRWADHPIDSIFARILANHPPPAIAAGAPMAVELPGPPPRDSASRLEGIATA